MVPTRVRNRLLEGKIKEVKGHQHHCQNIVSNLDASKTPAVREAETSEERRGALSLYPGYRWSRCPSPSVEGETEQGLAPFAILTTVAL